MPRWKVVGLSWKLIFWPHNEWLNRSPFTFKFAMTPTQCTEVQAQRFVEDLAAFLISQPNQTWRHPEAALRNTCLEIRLISIFLKGSWQSRKGRMIPQCQLDWPLFHFPFLSSHGVCFYKPVCLLSPSPSYPSPSGRGLTSTCHLLPASQVPTFSFCYVLVSISILGNILIGLSPLCTGLNSNNWC